MELLTAFSTSSCTSTATCSGWSRTTAPGSTRSCSLIIFCETGLVVTPFLPGDSLLFVAGTLAAAGDMYVHGLFAALAAGLVPRRQHQLLDRPLRRAARIHARKARGCSTRRTSQRTQRFYDKYGAKTIFIARFVPIVRTFAPFVAGIGRMRYPRFLFYSFSGSIAWVGSLTYAGYYFGNVPVVKQNLTLVIVVIVLLSIMPGIVEYLRHRSRSQRPNRQD